MASGNICPCGKVSYSYREAHELIGSFRRHQKRGMKRIPQRAYKCDVCGMYHVTSKKNDWYGKQGVMYER